MSIGINYISYNQNGYCPGCELRESIKLFGRLSKTLVTITHNQNNLKQIRKARNEYHKQRMQNDIGYRMKLNARNRVKSLVRLIKKKKSFHNLSKSKCIGRSTKEFEEYIQSKFREGMNWENYGQYGWHIDHIKPLSLFDLTNPEEFKIANHYTNIQPLWATTDIARQHGDFESIGNLNKGNKYEL
jgi:hypothetical protein